MTKRKRKWNPSTTRGTQRTYDTLAGIDAHAGRLQFESRILYLFTDIGSPDEEGMPSVTTLITGLRTLDAYAPGKPITLYINSLGGEISSGLSLIQVMRDLKSPVHTVVLGMAASMAAYVAVAGAKRYAYPTARYMMHRAKTWGVSGDHTDIDIEAKELKVVNAYCDQVLINFTSIKPEQLEAMTSKDFWFGTKEALKLGILDEVIIPRQGPNRWTPTKKGLEKDEGLWNKVKAQF